MPTVAFAVTQLLEGHFGRLVDYDFTARMEDDLDRIAAGDEARVAWLSASTSATGPGLHALTDHLDGSTPRRQLDRDRRRDRRVSAGTGLRRARRRAGQRARRPRPRRAHGREGRRAPRRPPPATAPSASTRVGARDRGQERALRPVRPEVLPEGETKPRRVVLFQAMSPETVTLGEALRLLSLPRVLEAPDGEEILVSNGRYGPFVKKGSETRSLESEEQLFTITTEEALAVLAQPKERRGRGAPPLRELGPDPTSGKPVVLKEAVSALRHRRRDECEPAARRRSGVGLDRARRRAARRAALEGPARSGSGPAPAPAR